MILYIFKNYFPIIKLGVLINEQWILTAGHCFQSEYNPYLSIDLGLHNRNLKESWTVTRKAAKVVIHPKFDIRIMLNDIAMIKLDVIERILIFVNSALI